MEVAKLRAWWFEKQGLGGSAGFKSQSEALSKAGWLRSVGGANPYLALYARTGATRESVDREAQDRTLHELPCLRGCTYVVSEPDYALALRLGRSEGDSPEIAMAKRHLGVTDQELDRLATRVLEVLKAGPLDPKEMKVPLGDAVRNLGEEGKKRGSSTTLPMVLGRLQSEGLIRRISGNGRFDNQRYRYALWDPSPKASQSIDLAAAQRQFARRYFEWAGPATKAAFLGIGGMGVKAAEAALAPLQLKQISADSEWLILPDEAERFAAYLPPAEPRYALVSNLDNLSHLRWGQIQSLVDEADRNRPAFVPKGLSNLGSLSDLESHAIYDRGRLVGLWEYDQQGECVVWKSFIGPDAELRSAVAKVEAFVRDQLGDVRSFSLDSPESRRSRIEALASA